MPFMPMTNDVSRKNYHILADFLKRISYKPRWRISITEDHNAFAFNVVVQYDGYESENAINTPLASQDERASSVAARLMGKTFRKPEKRCFTKQFYMLSLDHMAPENIIRHVIYETIQQAEMHELDRWFKIDGDGSF